jgi:hypothetical protein
MSLFDDDTPDPERVGRRGLRRDPPAATHKTLVQLTRRLKAARHKAGLTGVVVAKRAGLDQSVHFDLEALKVANPSLATLTRWASGLGFDLQLRLSKKKT